MYTVESMRARFAELTAKVDAIRASSPRLERDAKCADLTMSQITDFAARIKSHEAELYDMEQERALLVRAIRGKSS